MEIEIHHWYRTADIFAVAIAIAFDSIVILPSTMYPVQRTFFLYFNRIQIMARMAC